jgi:hypothetical protein
MGWVQKQFDETRAAWLVVASPDSVFHEMKRRALESGKLLRWTNAEAEKVLFERDHPMIDLALASYAVNSGTLMKVWQRSVTQHYPDKIVETGIQKACLSNEIALDFLGGQVLEKMVGVDALRAILTDKDSALPRVILQNGSMATMLVKLFQRAAPFDTVSDDDWAVLIHFAAGNDRINDNQDTSDGPDFEHWDLHKAIVHAVATAPTTIWIADAFSRFLLGVDKEHVRSISADSKAGLVEHWTVEKRNPDTAGRYNAYYVEGDAIDELRVILACIYGVSNPKPDSEDMAARAGYYANAKMSEEEVRAYADKDLDVFSLAILYNREALLDRKLRPVIEEVAYGQAFHDRHQKHYGWLRQKYRWFDPTPMAEHLQGDARSDGDQEEHPIINGLRELESRVDAKLAGLKKQIERSQRVIIWGVIVLGGFLAFIW